MMCRPGNSLVSVSVTFVTQLILKYQYDGSASYFQWHSYLENKAVLLKLNF